jgi:hypothetical protein
LEKNHYWIGLLDLYRAEVHLSLERYWEAQALATQAKAAFDALSIPSKRIFSLVLLGRVAMALNNLIAAERYAEEIAGIIKQIQMPLVLFPYHLLCGEIAERMHKSMKRELITGCGTRTRASSSATPSDLRVTFFKGRQRLRCDGRLSLDKSAESMNMPLYPRHAWCERAVARKADRTVVAYAPAGRPR